MTTQQSALWHDTAEDALRAVLQGVYGKGWSKKAAAAMWPMEDCVDKGRWLEKALTQDRNEKLGLTEILWILRLGRDHGIHCGMHFLNMEAGYDTPRTIEPRDEVAELQRQYIKAAEGMKQIAERIERVQVRAAS